jgi:hypothetical protein
MALCPAISLLSLWVYRRDTFFPYNLGVGKAICYNIAHMRRCSLGKPSMGYRIFMDRRYVRIMRRVMAIFLRLFFNNLNQIYLSIFIFNPAPDMGVWDGRPAPGHKKSFRISFLINIKEALL